MSRARDSSSGTPSASELREPGSQHGGGDAVAGRDLAAADHLGGQVDAELRGDVLRRCHARGFEHAGLVAGPRRRAGGQGDQQRPATGPVGGWPRGGDHGSGAGAGSDQAEGLQAGSDFGRGGERDTELGGDLAAGWQHVAVLQSPVADLLAVVLDDLDVGCVPLQRRVWAHRPMVPQPASCQ